MEFSFLFPPSLLPLFFKVGPIGRGREFSKDETTGVMQRGRRRGGERRGMELISTQDCFLRRRKE